MFFKFIHSVRGYAHDKHHRRYTRIWVNYVPYVPSVRGNATEAVFALLTPASDQPMRTQKALSLLWASKSELKTSPVSLLSSNKDSAYSLCQRQGLQNVKAAYDRAFYTLKALPRSESILCMLLRELR